ncbi:MAG: helix-turn-helix domain-containing protein [bacterium]|nr:helix-turn-helix domain-containing protein [bacterium]
MGSRATRIRRAREAAGLPQHTLAVILGVTTNTLARWERGEMAPRRRALASRLEAWLRVAEGLESK